MSNELKNSMKVYELVRIKFEGGFINNPISIDYENISYKLSSNKF